MSDTTATARRVQGVLPSHEALEGAGFRVRRPFPVPGLGEIDPFLLLDRMGPFDVAPGEAKGAPDHPHRGFETVTYLLEGEMEHEDSAGHKGALRPGDVQWMTAGAGVVHSEMPSRAVQERGGRVHGLQLWVNLPRADKLAPPRYQEYPADAIPVAEHDGTVLRVVAGTVPHPDGSGAMVTGPVETHRPILYVHATLPAGAALDLPVADGHTALVSVLAGTFTAGGHTAGDADLVVYDRTTPGPVTGTAGHEGADLLVLAGEPLNEPIVRWGPFVMNSRAEIEQAIDDYQAGRLGVISR